MAAAPGLLTPINCTFERYASSITLHERLGFKFRRWLDLVFYQLRLETPAEPVDG